MSADEHDQSTLPSMPDPWDYSALRVAERDDLSNSLLTQYGLDESWMGKHGDDLDDADDKTFWRYQFDRVYFYTRRVGDDQKDYFPVEFRTTIHTVGPPTKELKDFIREHANPRLQYIYDSGPYEGFMTGFNFGRHTSNIEDDEIAQDEAANLGIPHFEVLIMQNGGVAGQATGFFDPFALRERRRVRPTPGQEVWNLSFNTSRQSYQCAPDGYTGASKRSKQIRGKTVHVNGERVGDVTQDGRFWIKKEYDNPSQIYRGKRSRKFLVENTDATYSAIRAGGNLYKTRETDEAVYFVTAAAKPDDFDAVDPDDVDPDDTGEVIESRIDLDLEEEIPTDFNIRREVGMLDRHKTPTVRSTKNRTQFGTQPRMG